MKKNATSFSYFRVHASRPSSSAGPDFNNCGQSDDRDTLRAPGSPRLGQPGCAVGEPAAEAAEAGGGARLPPQPSERPTAPAAWPGGPGEEQQPACGVFSRGYSGESDGGGFRWTWLLWVNDVNHLMRLPRQLCATTLLLLFLKPSFTI